MKSFIGEYGRIIVVSLATLLLLGFAFGTGEREFLTILKTAKPETTVGTEDSSGLVVDLASRKPPTLTVTVKKLQVGKTYNLLDKAMFNIKATNADGNELSVSIIKMMDPEKNDITLSVDFNNFIPRKGTYAVTYHTEEIYMTATKATSKVYYFVVD